jgi:hypothetical protein
MVSQEVAFSTICNCIEHGPVQAWFWDDLTCFLVAGLIDQDSYIAQWSVCCGPTKQFVVKHKDLKRFDV